MSKSPNLEIISNDPKDSATGGGEDKQRPATLERRRVPRLNLATEHFRVAQNGKIFAVSDLSQGGLALRILDGNDLVLFSVGRMVEGTLNLKGEKYAIQVRVRHLGKDLVGCQFEGLTEEISSVLGKFLDPEMLGQELRPLPAGEGGALWYHGPSGTDLLLWRAMDGQYRRLAVFVQGSFAQWEQEKGVSTGRIRSSFEKSEMHGVVRFETMLLDTDEVPDSGKLNIAKTLVLSSNLPQDLKKWCSRILG